MLRLILFVTGIMVVAGLGVPVKYHNQATKSSATKTSVFHKLIRIPSVTKSLRGTTKHTLSTFDKNHPVTGHNLSTAKNGITSGKISSTSSRKQTSAFPHQPAKQSTTFPRHSTKQTSLPRRPITDKYKSTYKIHWQTSSQHSTKSKYQSTVGQQQSTIGNFQSASRRHQHTDKSSQTPLHHRNHTFPATKKPLSTEHPQTESQFFLCKDGLEILSSAQCDANVDCSDGSDENTYQCLGSPCPLGMFPCTNRNCVPLNVTCDKVDNCGDGSDEYPSTCQSNLQHTIHCANGQILKGYNLLCNSVYNCIDKSDEITCNICDGGMLCDDGTNCVKDSSICDRIRDCVDGADETCLNSDSQKCSVGEYLCTSGKCIPADEIDMEYSECFDSNGQSLENSTIECSKPSLLCDGGHTCVPASKRCDGKLDCRDKTDELNLILSVGTGTTFTCSNGYCLSYLYVCDGTDDCGDGSDESSADAGCLPVGQNCNNKFRCDNGLCVETYQVDNGIDDCGDGSDEKKYAASTFTCLNGKKIKYSYVCNGMNNCGDNSDETSCTSSGNSHLNPGHVCMEHTCPSGTCIYYSEICDGFNDCGDDSDEKSCYSWPWTNTLAIGLSVSGGVFLIMMSVFIIRRRRQMIAVSRIINRSGLRSTTYAEIPSNARVEGHQDQGYSNPIYWEASVNLTNGK